MATIVSFVKKQFTEENVEEIEGEMFQVFAKIQPKFQNLPERR